MANSTVTDFTIYDPTFYAAQVESLAENIALFGSALAMNGGRAPAINLRSRSITGFVERSTTFKLPSNTINRRDPTNITNEPPDAYIEDVEHVGVKIASRIGPFMDTYDKFIKRGNSIEMQSFVVGQATGEYMFKDYITTALSAVVAAIVNDGTMVVDISTGDYSGKLTQATLIAAKRKMGDQASTLNTIITPSGPYFDVMADSYSVDKATVADMIVNAGANPTLGMPSVVTDNPILSFLDTTNKHYVLLLTDDAVTVTESEGRARMYAQQVLGLENVGLRLQGEHSYNLDVKGNAYNVGAGGNSPNNAAIALSTNWDLYKSSARHGPGVLIICDGVA